MGPHGAGLGNTSLNFDDDIACELRIMPTQHVRHISVHIRKRSPTRTLRRDQSQLTVAHLRTARQIQCCGITELVIERLECQHAPEFEWIAPTVGPLPENRKQNSRIGRTEDSHTRTNKQRQNRN